MSKALLIDGSSLLVSNYYGTLPPEACDESGYDSIPKVNGLYVNAIYPTIKQILDIAISADVDYLGVAFDKGRNTFRRQINADYKANRKETPLPLKEQFNTCEKILKKLGIFTISSEEYEADDLIGSIAKQYSIFCDKTILLTKDKDYIQLVDEFITVWMMLYKKEVADEKLKELKLTKEDGFNEYLPPRVVPYTPATVYKDKYGISPEHFNEVLALVGDKADNIKGVKGISEEVGYKLIAEYNTIQELYEEIEHANFNKSGKQLKQYWKDHLNISRSPFNALIDYEEDARQSLELATIKTDIDLGNFYIEKLAIPKIFYSFKQEYENGFNYFKNAVYANIKKIIESLKET